MTLRELPVLIFGAPTAIAGIIFGLSFGDGIIASLAFAIGFGCAGLIIGGYLGAGVGVLLEKRLHRALDREKQEVDTPPLKRPRQNE